MIKMEVVEGRELSKMFRRRGKRAKDAGDRALLRVASQISRDARQLVPKAGGHGKRPTGRLKASIAHKLIRPRDGVSDAIVGTKTYYAYFLEFGTGEAGKNSGAQAVGRHKVHKYGGGHGAKGGKKRSRDKIGMPAHPFLGPAYRSKIQQIQGIVAAELEKAVMEGDSNG